MVGLGGQPWPWMGTSSRAESLILSVLVRVARNNLASEDSGKLGQDKWVEIAG